MYENNRGNFIGTIIAQVFSALAGTYTAVFLQKIIDLGITGTLKDVAVMAVVGVVYILTTVIIELARRHYKNSYYKKAIVQLKAEMFQRITTKNISTFQNESTAEYISEFTNDIISVHDNYLVNTVENLVGGALSFGFALFLMLRYNILLTIISILIMILSFIPTMLAGRDVPMMEEDVSNENGRFTSLVKDLLGGFPVIKNFRVEDRAVRLFNDENERLEGITKWYAWYSEVPYYPYKYDIWQYSDKGKVDGIKGNVDQNISFNAFWE